MITTTIVAIALYLIATVLLLKSILAGEQTDAQNQNKPGTSKFVVAAATAHAALLYQTVILHWVNLEFFHSLSTAAWLVVVILLVTNLSKPTESLGLLVYPMAIVTLILELVFANNLNFEQPIRAASAALDSHIFLSMLAYSILGLAAAQALLLSLQDYQLRNKHPGGFMRSLPPLTTVESLMFNMIIGGFILLTMSLVSGWIFIDDLFAQHLLHKTLFSLIAWLLFATLLHGRYHYGWRGKTATNLTIIGFSLVVVGYFGSKFVLEIIL